ncbi:ubiquinol-cytochrome C chaperone family protein [Phyllobacterium myrsinacearum]|uniref:Cytochrome b pre-mRNA-processing protein 3 n=1 Tax=Phyllobacterium myrsinacearum TaxID=28101 RepID=A0A839ED92_9HYPH|nr:ubiquinol-cytochrome C chaperone family protein [Phyllobacterium myrsinacearum]MBA8876398.1 cytochrome b pre-mRNA-processing protein 3 [Phyllobacterium myrsinacearum]
MILSLFSRKAKANEAITTALYDAIVAAARQPYFYSDIDVPDSPLGRYEMLSLHVFLFMRRIKGRTPALKMIGQEVTDEFFRDVDHSLRELGIGDSGIPKRMKKLARMFYGRVESYDKALQANDYPALAAALARNVRPDSKTWPQAADLAKYTVEAALLLETQSDDDFAGGHLLFPDAGVVAETQQN